MAKFILKEGTLTKSDFTVDIEVKDIAPHYEQLVKKIKEIEGQIQVEEGKIGNYEQNNPDILDIDEEKRHAICLHYNANVTKKESEDLLKKYKVVIKEFKDEVKDINKQTKANIKLNAG